MTENKQKDEKAFDSHDVISEQLNIPHVMGSVCTCTKFRETPMINGKHICSICNKPIAKTDL